MIEPLAEYRDDGPIAETLGGVLPTVSFVVVLIAGLVPLGLTVWLLEGEAGVWIALAWFVVLGSASSRAAGKLFWLVPSVLQTAEYGFVIAVVAFVDLTAVGAAFAMLGALSYHHYDTVYRLRHQSSAPPSWLRWALGGWELRMIAVMALSATDALFEGLIVLAVWIAGLSVAESVRSWTSTPMHAGEDLGLDA